MRKIIVLFISVIFFPSVLSGQFEGSLGATVFNLHSPNFGITAGVGIERFHFEISSNLKGEDGTQQDYSTASNLNTNNHFIFLFNTGYYFPLSEKVSLSPVIGLGWQSDIYIRNIGEPKYFYDNWSTFLNLGLAAKINIKKDIGLLIGAGYPEIFRASLVYRLW